MIIEKLEFSNWGPHQHLVWDCNAPVIGVLGDNASGKTHIIEGIGFAFTGRLGKYASRKNREVETFIYEHEGVRAANAFVKASFRKGGLRGTIFRQIGKTTKRELTWEGLESGKVLTSAKDVEELLTEIMDCDRDAIELAVFLGQGEMGKFLFGNPAGREVDFARMCLIDHLEDVSSVAMQEMMKLQKRIVDLAPQRDEASRHGKEQLDALELAEANLKLTPDSSGRLRLLRAQQEKESSLLSSSRALEAANLKLSVRQRDSAEIPTREKLDQDVRHAAKALQKCQEQMKTAEELGRQLARRKAIEVRQAEIDTTVAKLPDINAQLGILKDERNKDENSKTLLDEALVKVRAELVEASRLCDRVAERDKLAERIRNGTTLKEQSEKKLEQLSGFVALTPESEQAEREAIKVLRDSVVLIPLVIQMSEHSEHEAKTCVLCGSADWKGFPDGAKIAEMRLQLAKTNEVIRERELKLQEQIRERHNNVEAQAAEREQLRRITELLTTLGTTMDTFADVAVAPDTTALVLRRDELLVSLAEADKKIGALSLRIKDFEHTLAFGQAAAEENVRLTDELRTLLPSADLEAELAQPVGDVTVATATYEAAAAQLQKRVSIDVELTAIRAEVDRQQESITAGKAGALAGRKAIEIGEEADLLILIQAAEEALRLHDQNKGVRDNAISAFRRAEARLLEIEEKQRDQEGIKDLIGQLDEIRVLFGRGGIPRAYLSKVFDSLVEETQELLMLWEEDMQVEKDEETLFNFKFWRTSDPETIMDQSQLSGGQRNRLSLAFCMAAQSLLFPGLGFLTADEPSTHMDASGKQGLVRLFRKIAQHAEGEGSQVWVIDHAVELEPGFSKVYRLTSADGVSDSP
jgi:DNA repair exonuclease SbcCD ATPase subunit